MGSGNVPELPEVETLRRGLDREVRSQRIVAVEVANAVVLKGQSEREFRDRAVNTAITQVGRRGKYLLISLSPAVEIDPPEVKPTSPITLCVHLKMRGQLLLEPVLSNPGPYLCVSLILEKTETDGESPQQSVLRFYDMWRWGEIRALTQDELGRIDGLAKMGPEPLEPGWNGSVLGLKLAGRRGPVKLTLLDQSVVAGVGNIYADESLFRAGIQPERPANSLDPSELDRLTNAIRGVLTEAVAGGGTMSDEYVDLGGAAGKFEPRVYDRGGAPCLTCGTALTRIRLGGRGTVFCPSCQN